MCNHIRACPGVRWFHRHRSQLTLINEYSMHRSRLRCHFFIQMPFCRSSQIDDYDCISSSTIRNGEKLPPVNIEDCLHWKKTSTMTRYSQLQHDTSPSSSSACQKVKKKLSVHSAFEFNFKRECNCLWQTHRSSRQPPADELFKRFSWLICLTWSVNRLICWSVRR